MLPRLKPLLLPLLLAVTSHAFADETPSAVGEENTPSKTLAVDFQRDVLPIFRTHCMKCHGPSKREGGLRLDGKKLAFEGGDSGPVIVAGKPDASDLMKRVLSDDEDIRMPPGSTRLSAKQVGTLGRWISAGAPWPGDVDDVRHTPDFWSFQPITAVEPPTRNESHPIDRFVRERLHKAGLAPSTPAGRHTLLRRLSLDLTGLPPSGDLQQRFGSGKMTVEQVADELLDSPHFGERWAMPWLDMARFADSDGYEKDLPRPHAWHWRDWVIDAVNRDLPFDQFTVQQLAGDLLPGATDRVKLATGFHRNTLTNREGGVDAEEFRVKAVVDRLNTTFSVWMGLTVGCAQCHTHKYDPITQREYYRLFAFFNDANEQDLSIAATPQQTRDYEQKVAEFERRLKELEQQFTNARPELETRFQEWETRQRELLNARWQPLKPLNRRIDGRTLELTAATTLRQVTGLRVQPSAEPAPDAVISHVEVAVESATETGPIWLDTATMELSGKRSANLAVLNRQSPAGWTLAKDAGELTLTTSLPPGSEGWQGNRLASGSQDGATNLLNVYYNSPVSSRGSVARIRVFTEAVKNNTFTVLLLRPEGEGLRVVDQQTWTADGQTGEREYELGQPWRVQRGDLFAHWGNGGPTFGPGKKTKDVIYYPLPSRPQNEALIRTSTLPKIGSREYSLRYLFTPAETASDAKFARPEWSSDDARLTVRLRFEQDVPTDAAFGILVTDADDPLNGGLDGLSNELTQIVLKTSRSAAEQAKLFDHFVGQDETGKKLKQQLENHKKAQPKKPTQTIHVMTQGNPRRTHVHVRGDFLKKGVEVQPQSPAFLPPLKTRADRPDRLDLARWLVSPSNPLTPRVAVNQIWAELFGQGLVRTVEDFGTQGEPPSHPALLDWLATEFQRLGWSRKRLIKRIVLSETYQQSSNNRPELLEQDPENRLLARQNRIRLNAELVRDQFLAASGLLNDQVGGPSFRPPLPASVTRVQFINQWKADQGDTLYRRGLYIHLQRNLMLPMFATFDRPDTSLTCSRRVRSNTPLQALTLLNGTVFVASSRALARSLLTDANDDAKRTELLFRRAVSRPPSDFERQRIGRLIRALDERYGEDTTLAGALIGDDLLNGLDNVSAQHAAAWVVACRTVLNLDEVITRE